MFVVTLKNGQCLDFGGKCHKVDYSNKNMVLFKNENETAFISLAIIPTENILTIINKTEEDIK